MAGETIMNDHDLSPERARALSMLSDIARPLGNLIVDRPPFATLILRACDYMYFLQVGWITDGATVALTEAGQAAKKALQARRAFDPARFEAGDQVGIYWIEPIISRKYARVLHWTAKTDSDYRLTLYPEDFTALKNAGYRVPDFDNRAAQAVEWEVYVSREPDKKTGWRMAGVVAR